MFCTTTNFIIKLTIVIPIYNRENTIANTLFSILQQSANPFNYEVIIVDDGSTDQSINVCQKFAEQYSQIRVLTQPNSGPGSARNKGLSYAQGEYVWFVDSDDQIDSNAFYILNSYLDGKIDAVTFASADVIEGTKRRRQSYDSIQNQQISGQQFINQSISVNFFSYSFHFSVNIPLTIFRRIYLLNNHINMKERIYHEDFEFMPRAYFYMQRVTAINSILYLVNQTPGSITRTANSKKAFDYLTVVRSLTDFVLSNPSSNNRKLWVAIDVAFCNSIFEIWRAGKEDISNYLKELQHHANNYIFALRNSRHSKFLFMAILLRLSPSLLIWTYNKVLAKL